MGDDLLHDRTEARNRSGPQVVAVAESPGQDYQINALQVVFLVPQIDGVLTEMVRDRVEGVLIAVRTREANDAGFHASPTAAISKSSVTGLARSFSHIARAWSRAESSEAALISTMT